jgi:hypothetical protein
MRLKIIIASALLVVGLLFVVLRRSSPPLSLSFLTFSDGGFAATFYVTNHTRHDYLYFRSMQTQFLTATGWANYLDPATRAAIPYFRLLGARSNEMAVALLPPGEHRVRASLRCRRSVEDQSGWRSQLTRLLRAVGIGRSTNEFTIYSEEFVR